MKVIHSLSSSSSSMHDHVVNTIRTSIVGKQMILIENMMSLITGNLDIHSWLCQDHTFVAASEMGDVRLSDVNAMRTTVNGSMALRTPYLCMALMATS